MSKLSVVIPSTGNIVNLRRLLRSLERQTLKRQDFSIFLVLNGVEDEKRPIYQKICDEFDVAISLVLLQSKGVNYARSWGLQQAKSAVIFFIDDDCEVDDPQMLEWHLRFHTENRTVFAVGGGYQLPANSGYFDELYNEIQMHWLYSGKSEKSSRFLLGGNFSIKKEIAEKFNLDFDGYIAYGGSETDFFRQAERENLPMLVSEKDLLHHTTESFSSLNRKIYKQGRGAAYTDMKYGPSQSADQVPEALSAGFFRKTLRTYFNYVFWFGYYRHKKHILALFRHVMNDMWGNFHRMRTRLNEKLSLSVSDRKKNGKRF